MTNLRWPLMTALAIALTGCHAIYGDHGSPPPAAITETPLPAPAAAESTTAPPSGGSGATVATVGAGTAADSIAGTLAGSYFGNRLGSQFDGPARQAAATAERRALADNAPADWSDPSSGTSGRVRPLRSFTDAAGRECREYSQTVNIGGRRHSDTGIACLQSAGNWSLVGS
ncbi:MAG TPA: RT0821/Lpp0805 family surface protein [Stellaceae bacterium]|nr:RT0821/Lpp0805 family surface protein [Stellaceae bacterium]